jgi:hypothetical protein
MKYLVAAFIGGFIVLIAYQFIIVKPEQNEKARARYEQADKEIAARYEKWAYVEKEKDISSYESIKLIVVPDKGGFRDARCLVYVNSKTNTSSITCGDMVPE